MLKKLLCLFSLFFTTGSGLNAHCQMPCGIYHDEMVYDQIDQYVETMVKAVSILEDNPMKTPQDRNVVIRWTMEKENESNRVSHIICDFFLQQKIKPGEADTAKRVLSAHLLLFYIVKIKQTVDLTVINDFYQEWEKFKLMFHIEGYKCRVAKERLKKWMPEEDHDHDDEHSHDEETEDKKEEAKG